MARWLQFDAGGIVDRERKKPIAADADILSLLAHSEHGEHVAITPS
jgi:hypothetical protein